MSQKINAFAYKLYGIIPIEFHLLISILKVLSGIYNTAFCILEFILAVFKMFDPEF